MKNVKGFMLAELIVVTTVMITFFTLVYAEFSETYINTINYSKYNNIQKLYAANEVKELILSENGEDLETYITTTLGSASYVSLTDCTDFDNTNYCILLKTELDVSKIYLTKYNTKDLQTYIGNNPATFDTETKRYIRTLFYSDIAGIYDNVYTIILEFTDGDFSYINVNQPYGFVPEVIVDSVSPELVLNGEAEIDIELGDPFIDPGVTVTDNYDKHFDVERTGSVDTCTSGDYVITYNVTDVSGNEASVSRTVTVKPGYYLDFDGTTGDYVDIPDLASTVDFNSGFTVEMEIKYDTFASTGYIMSFGTAANADRILLYNPANYTYLRIYIQSGTSSAYPQYESNDVLRHKWILTMEADKTFDLQKDNLQVLSTTHTYVPRNLLRDANYLGYNTYNGRIYNFKITLNTGEVLMWYKINEGTGTTLTDSSSNGYHATIYGATWKQYNSCHY